MAGKSPPCGIEKFGVIVADPGWHDHVYSEQTAGRQAAFHYMTVPIEVIKALAVASIAADDCVLFLWSTNQHLREAMDVLEEWGFAYASHYIWRKPSMGRGYWNRSVHEVLLIGTRGGIPCPAPGAQHKSVIDAPRGERHSEKPEVFLEMIELYFPTLPKIELNRRGPPRPGWKAWGNQAEQPYDPTEDTSESANRPGDQPPCDAASPASEAQEVSSNKSAAEALLNSGDPGPPPDFLLRGSKP